MIPEKVRAGFVWVDFRKSLIVSLISEKSDFADLVRARVTVTCSRVAQTVIVHVPHEKCTLTFS